MSLQTYKRIVGAFSARLDLEQAIHELNQAGLPMQQVSVIAKHADKDTSVAGVDVSRTPAELADKRVDNKADDGAKTGVAAGAALGGVTGLLVGLGTLAIPGVGPILLAGTVATALATTAAGTAIGAAAGGILGALVGLGIPEERAKVYNDRIARGDYLVMVDGTDAEITRAERILLNHGAHDIGIFDAALPAGTDDRRATVSDRTTQP